LKSGINARCALLVTRCWFSGAGRRPYGAEPFVFALRAVREPSLRFHFNLSERDGKVHDSERKGGKEAPKFKHQIPNKSQIPKCRKKKRIQET
jgi:hypothetical protein